MTSRSLNALGLVFGIVIPTFVAVSLAANLIINSVLTFTDSNQGPILQNLFCRNTIAVKLPQDFDALVSFQVHIFAPASKDKVIFILIGKICRCKLILCHHFGYSRCVTAK